MNEQERTRYTIWALRIAWIFTLLVAVVLGAILIFQESPQQAYERGRFLGFAEGAVETYYQTVKRDSLADIPDTLENNDDWIATAIPDSLFAKVDGATEDTIPVERCLTFDSTDKMSGGWLIEW